jgi:hypothetical protein
MMKTNTLVCALAALTFSVSLPLSASDESEDIYTSDNTLNRISVQWLAPKKFTDVREANFSNAKFRKRVFSQLEKHLDKLAEDLPSGQTLAVSVTDVDLAGRIEPASFVGLSSTMDDVRVMRNVDIPRIEFTYQLLDANGVVLKSEEVNLKNMNYLHDIRFSGRDKPFGHEKRMLSKWFAKSLINDNV